MSQRTSASSSIFRIRWPLPSPVDRDSFTFPSLRHCDWTRLMASLSVLAIPTRPDSTTRHDTFLAHKPQPRTRSTSRTRTNSPRVCNVRCLSFFGGSHPQNTLAATYSCRLLSHSGARASPVDVPSLLYALQTRYIPCPDSPLRCSSTLRDTLSRTDVEPRRPPSPSLSLLSLCPQLRCLESKMSDGLSLEVARCAIPTEKPRPNPSTAPIPIHPITDRVGSADSVEDGNRLGTDRDRLLRNVTRLPPGDVPQLSIGISA